MSALLVSYTVQCILYNAVLSKKRH